MEFVCKRGKFNMLNRYWIFICLSLSCFLYDFVLFAAQKNSFKRIFVVSFFFVCEKVKRLELRSLNPIFSNNLFILIYVQRNSKHKESDKTRKFKEKKRMEICAYLRTLTDWRLTFYSIFYSTRLLLRFQLN